MWIITLQNHVCLVQSSYDHITSNQCQTKLLSWHVYDVRIMKCQFTICRFDDLCIRRSNSAHVRSISYGFVPLFIQKIISNQFHFEQSHVRNKCSEKNTNACYNTEINDPLSHKNISNQKIAFFLYFVRSRTYSLPLDELSTETFEESWMNMCACVLTSVGWSDTTFENIWKLLTIFSWCFHL